MSADWAAMAAWVGALGGFSGFASLAATAYWRQRDRRQLEHDRVSVNRVNQGTYGLDFWVSYVSPTSNESLRVRVEVLNSGPKGPFVQSRVMHQYDPKTGVAPEAKPEGRSCDVNEPLGRWSNDPPLVYAQNFVLFGNPLPSKGKLRVTVRGSASERVLARRVLHIAP
jgi:hypothetical protein